DNGVSVVHCPASNLKLANGQCPVSLMLASNINVCLGTDGAASNNDLDIINEMHLAALVGKVTANDAGAIPAWQALAMATINGARAMGLDDRIGSLETGKFADILALDLNHVSTQPVYDVASTLVYSASASQVSHLWVGGQLTVEHGRLLTLDVSQIIHKAQQWSELIKSDN
ncbi:MAG: amidohydrolase family protein, partial [Pseudohongiellaceae bacterium]